MNARLVAVTGSQDWPQELAYIVTDALDEQLTKTRPGATLLVRHGAAKRGADHIAHQWVRHQKANPSRPDVTVLEDPVPADWDTCAPTCKPDHRRTRDDGTTWCPSAGHRRNPEVVAGVHLVLAFCWNDSSGTTKTIEHTRRNRINHRTWHAYGPTRPR
ncbi:hypothetical protein ACFY05_31895 [Microtetraspora fusca]|uniref:DUF2493 domain-containing protein n=1 Tax=Microtetraspora fusca TaxID=1997 RepID=A0ABW6VDN7_MICFU